MKHLRKIRQVSAVVVFVLMFLVFFNPYGFFSYIGKFVEGTQFTPALLNSILHNSLRSIIALIILLALTFFFGRIYCSFLCPLGTLQDLVIRVTGKKKFKTIKKNNLLRYGILIVTVVSAAAGSLFFVRLLDPYSIFGRSALHLFGRGFIVSQNAVSDFLSSFQVYFIENISLPFVSIALIVFVLVQLSLVVFISARNGRLYCNLICPVGTLLGLLSKVSLFKLVLPKTCVNCGACENICRAGCISIKEGMIDNELCVRCYDCMAVCPHSGILFSRKESSFSDVKRRLFVNKSIAITLGSIVAIFPLRFLFKMKPLKAEKRVIVPPGSLSIANFSSSCISCHLCVSVCPTKILTPLLFSSGRGMMQPHIEYSGGFCQYNCSRCSEVCPTDAIRPLSIEQKQRTVIGKVQYIPDQCIVHVSGTECGACAEHCPTGAVTTRQVGSLNYPQINESLCIGCGACEYACPVEPLAIAVIPKDVHTILAEKKDTDEDVRVEEEDFPF